MREIKVRVWQDLETIGLCSRIFDLKNKTDLIVYVNEFEDFKDIDLFSGLLDKNGKEIYEGDIVIVTNTVWKDTIATVEWENQHACFIVDCGEFFGYKETSMAFSDYFEIIGNIHQTPELLENK